MSKKILIIYAHPNPKSFTHAILDTVLDACKEKHYETTVRDLYGIKFNPILSFEDLAAFKEGKTPKDIAEEQYYINWCDLMVFICPVWWSELPAIARGYIDRVLSYGFAYIDEGDIVKGLLTNKEVVVFQPQGCRVDQTEDEIWPAMNVIIGESTFEFCGMKNLGLHFYPSVTKVDDETRKGYLNEISKFFINLK